MWLLAPMLKGGQTCPSYSLPGIPDNARSGARSRGRDVPTASWSQGVLAWRGLRAPPAGQAARAPWANASPNRQEPPMTRQSERGMGLSTFRQRARVEIEIGTWGSLVTALLFFTSGIVDYFTTDDVSWISTLGCLTGLATIASIMVRAHLANATLRARRALRRLRTH